MRLLADGLTPIGLYRSLAAERPGTFLLESAEQGSWSRYSFVGVRCAATLTASTDGDARWHGEVPVGIPVSGDPLQVLRASVEALHTPGTPRACRRSPAAWSATSATTWSAYWRSCRSSPRTT